MASEKTGMAYCKERVAKMISRSQTKVIFPLITLGLVRAHEKTEQRVFSNLEIKAVYERAVRSMHGYLEHDLHVGGKYYDAYPSRNLPKYGVLRAQGEGKYKLLAPYADHAEALAEWIPHQIKEYIEEKLGVIPRLGSNPFRAKLAAKPSAFSTLIEEHFDENPANFEIFSFAVIKVHLEKFACKVYRDTRTAARDSGVDIATNFGAVYQIKKLKVLNKNTADEIYNELQMNFDRERLEDGSVILVIDDISKEIKNYLIDMEVQSISKSDILKLAGQFEDVEDKQKVLRIIYEEFRREYSSTI